MNLNHHITKSTIIITVTATRCTRE